MNEEIHKDLTKVYLDLYLDYECDNLYRTLSNATDVEPVNFKSIYSHINNLIGLLKEARSRLKKIEGDLYGNNNK